MSGRNRRQLRGLNILVTEDDLFVAMDLADTLEAAGAEVMGPVSSSARAMKLLEHRQPDAAVLDIRLGSEFVFPLAEALAAQQVPFLFASGCNPKIIPEKFGHVPLCEKPAGSEKVVQLLSQMTGRTP